MSPKCSAHLARALSSTFLRCVSPPRDLWVLPSYFYGVIQYRATGAACKEDTKLPWYEIDCDSLEVVDAAVANGDIDAIANDPIYQACSSIAHLLSQDLAVARTCEDGDGGGGADGDGNGR